MGKFIFQFSLVLVLMSSCKYLTNKKEMVSVKKDPPANVSTQFPETNMSAEFIDTLVSEFLKEYAKTQENRIFYKIENLQSNKDGIDAFVFKRYGAVSARAAEAIEILINYNLRLNQQNDFQTKTQIAGYKFIKDGNLNKGVQNLDAMNLLLALNYLLEDREFIGESDNFRLDIVDVLREILILTNNKKYHNLQKDLKSKNSTSFSKHTEELLTSLENLDNVLAVRNEFSFGSLLSEMKSKGKTSTDKKLIEEKFSQKVIASNYQLAGVIKTFYWPLWKTYFNYLQTDFTQQDLENQKNFKKDVAIFSKNWMRQTKDLPSFSQEDEVDVVLEFLEK